MIYVYIYIYMCIYIYMYVYLYIYIYIYFIYLFIYIYIYLFTYVYIFFLLCIYIYICIYLYIYACFLRVVCVSPCVSLMGPSLSGYKLIFELIPCISCVLLSPCLEKNPSSKYSIEYGEVMRFHPAQVVFPPRRVPLSNCLEPQSWHAQGLRRGMGQTWYFC